jgi:hypothetical protein
MKNHIKFIVTVLAVFVLTALFTVLNAQSPVVNINFNQRELVPGSTVQVPVIMNGNSIGNWQLIINYDRSVLTYVSTANTVSGSGGFFSVNPSYSNANLLGGQPCFKATYAISNPGLNYNNQAVVTITFIYHGGGSYLTFSNIATTTSNTQAYYTFVATFPGGSGGTINLGTAFSNGTAACPLHSTEAGGAWRSRSTWTENAKPHALCDIQITGSEVVVDSTAACTNLIIDDGAKLRVNQGINLNVFGNFILKSENPSAGLRDPGNGFDLKGEKIIEK